MTVGSSLRSSSKCCGASQSRQRHRRLPPSKRRRPPDPGSRARGSTSEGALDEVPRDLHAAILLVGDLLKGRLAEIEIARVTARALVEDANHDGALRSGHRDAAL